jgi:formylglycine-generating enzyme required for sulfatase activity
LAWLDSKPKTLMPAMDSPAAQFNRDEVYTFIPNSVEFLELESFSVGGEEGKFYPVVWKAQEGDKGPLEFEIFHGSERGNLVSQFSCHFQQDKQSFAEIQQQSQRWVANAWCSPSENLGMVYLRGGETRYSWRSGSKSVVLLDSKRPVMESIAAKFDKDEVQVSLSSIKMLEGRAFQDRLKDGGFGPEMVSIPAGRFKMGDIQGGGDSDEKPALQWVAMR